jgi:hypothetical protein
MEMRYKLLSRAMSAGVLVLVLAVAAGCNIETRWSGNIPFGVRSIGGHTKGVEHTTLFTRMYHSPVPTNQTAVTCTGGLISSHKVVPAHQGPGASGRTLARVRAGTRYCWKITLGQNYGGTYYFEGAQVSAK